MSSLDRRLIILAILLFLTVLGVWKLNPTPGAFDEREVLKQVPMEIGDWVGEELEVRQREIEILGTNAILARKYTRPGVEPLYLSIVYSEKRRGTSHPPDVCYTGDGWTITKKNTRVITPVTGENFAVNSRLLTKGDLYYENILFWYQTGDTITTSFYHQQLKVILNRILKNHSNEALVRVSIRASEDRIGSEEIQSQLTEFSSLLNPILMSAFN
jgi:EpsI family protein